MDPRETVSGYHLETQVRYGISTVVMGKVCVALGHRAVAMCYNSVRYGISAVVMGHVSVALGHRAVDMCYNSQLGLSIHAH